MTILRAQPGAEVKLGEKVYTANKHGLVLVAPEEATVLRAHGFTPVLNTNEVRDPGPTDDGNAGHSIGSTWNNRVAQTAFVCLDSSPLKAVWKDVAGRDEAFALLDIQLPPAESTATNPDGGNAGGDADQPPAAISDPENDGGGLVGSSTAPSEYELEDGNKVQLGQIVAEAHKRSGLSVADWNSLPEDERTLQIELVAEELPLKKPDSPPAGKPVESADAGATDQPAAAQDPQAGQPSPAIDAGPAPHADAGSADQPKAADAEQVHSNPAEQNGEAPAASASTDPASDKTLEEKVLDAALSLNHDDDAHWTKDGLPNVNVLAEKVSASLTRALVTAVLGEDFKRKTK